MKNICFIFIILLFSCSESKEVKRQQLFLKGNIALEEQKYDQAIYYYNQSIELSDTFPSVYNNRAIAYEEMGRHQEAFGDFEKVISLKQDFWPAYFNRAKLWQETGNYYNALSDLEVIQVPYQDSASYYFVEGLSYSGLKKYEQAEKSFLKAKQLDSKNPENTINLATVYYFQDQFDKAEQQLKSIDYNSQAQALNLLGLIQNEKEDFIQSIEYFTQAIQISPNPYYYNNRGYARLKLGELDSGFEDIKYSLLKDEKNPWAYRNKGIYHFLKEDYGQAQASLSQAYKMDTTVELTNYYLGRTNYQLGDIDEACKFLYRSSQLGEEKGQQFFEEYCR